MSILPHPCPERSEWITRRRFLASLIPRFAAGLVFLPLIANQPDQPSTGRVDFYCDVGEQAMCQFYLANAGALTVEYWFLDAGELTNRRVYYVTPKYGRVRGWFRAHPQDQLLYVLYFATMPAWVSFATCVI